jgi:hypothetical protein
VTVAQFHIPALTLCRPTDELLNWAASAKIGERFVYAVGRVEPRSDPVWKLAGSLADARRVTLIRNRRPDGPIEFIAERIREMPRPAEAPRVDEDDEAVMRIVRRCIKLRLPMRTNAEIARECSMKDAARASYVMRRLTLRNWITVLDMGPNQRRVVTDLTTREKTPEGAL